MKKVDRNQPEIVRALRRAGASVQSLASVGKGCPDLAVGLKGQTWLIEVKDWQQPPSRKRLSPDEKLWHQSWQGHVAVAETVEDALRIVGLL